MPSFTDITGLLSVASAVAAALLLVPGIARFAKLHLALLVAIFVLMLFPFGGMPFAAFVRGVTGDLSITTLVLLWSALARPWCNCDLSDRESRYPLLMLIAFVALALYPMALGAGTFDPYGLGYGDPAFVAALLLVALGAWFWRFPIIALCIAFATLAWSVGWYESDNLWDYLLDPLVAIYASAAIMIRLVKVSTHLSRSNVP